MAKPERQLRMIQIACIVLLGCFTVLAYVTAHQNSQPATHIGLGQGIIVVFALWPGVWGFLMQRTLLRRRQPTSSKSTPFTRWRTGHIFRLWSAVTVGIWALLLVEFHGPLWISYVLFGFAMLLLLIWRPDAFPSVERR